MPIKLPLKGKLSNKTQTLSKTTDSDTDIPKVSKPFIDKISVIVKPATTADASDIHDAFWASADDKSLFASASNVKIGGYNTSKRLLLDSAVDFKRMPLLSVAYDKQKSLMKSLRFEFVPVDLGPEGMEEMSIKTMSLMDNGWAYAVTNGTISRLDVAIDVENTNMEAFLFLADMATSTHYWQQNGQLESIYSGKPKGNQTAIYDRGKKRKAKGQKWDKPSTVRIERRLKNLGLKLNELPSLDNPFAKMTLTESMPPAPSNGKGWEWLMFTDSVKVRGLTAALALLPTKRRTAYRDHLKKHQKIWWKPTESWNYWEQMIEELRIADPTW